MPFWLKKKLDNQNAALSKTWQYESGMIRVEWNDANKSRWKASLETVKALEGARFDPAKKVWFVASTKGNEAILEASAFRHKKVQAPEKILPPPQWHTFEIEESRLMPGLRDYQVDFMRFMCWRRGQGALLGDPVGVGKTVQAMGWMHYTQAYPVLVVTTATTKSQWAKEISKWLPSHIYQTIQGTKSAPLRHITTLVNWDILYAWEKELLSVPWKLIVADEIQAIGNMTSKRTKAFMKIAKKHGPVLGLSGTPMRTKPYQFFPILNTVAPNLFTNIVEFRERYCQPKHDGYGWTFNGAENMAELHSFASRCMIRREKSILNLPPMERIPVILDTTGMEEYLKQEAEFYEKAALLTKGKIKENELDKKLMELGRSSFKIKEPAALDWIKEQLDSDNEKMLIMCWHTAVLDKLMLDLKDYKPVAINGEVIGKARDRAKAEFISGKSRVLIGNWLAAGVGLDGLQGVCSRGVALEFPISPNDIIQGEGRLWRSGQVGGVQWFYLLADGTIDEKILKVLNTRAAIMETILDGKRVECGGFAMELAKQK